jgi:hypothetical protein
VSANINPTIILPEFKPDASGRLTARCPKIPNAENYHCWMIENPDTSARYDFWVMVAVVRNGLITMLSMVVPLEDGKLQHFIQLGEYSYYFKSTFLKVMKQSHGDFGVISKLKLEAKTYYHALQKTFLGARFRVGIVDPESDLPASYQEVSAYDFPPLPIAPDSLSAVRAVLPVETAIRLIEPESYREGRRIHFPHFEEDGDDFIVDGGEEVPTGPEGFVSIAASLDDPYPPGIHWEIINHKGDPAHSLSLFWFQPRPGSSAEPRILFGDKCSEGSYARLVEQIFVKKKKSWFRKRKKITVIHKILVSGELPCAALPSGG